MPIFKWDDSFSVGIKEFDGHHKKLMDLINQLHDAMAQGKGQVELEVILAELVNYTHTHFASEERAMVQYGLPRMAIHKAAHDALTKKVLDFQKQFKEGKLGLTIQVISFLKEWLTDHIMKEDKLYGAFFHEKGLV